MPRGLTPARAALALGALLAIGLLAAWLPCRILSCHGHGAVRACDALFLAFEPEIENGLDGDWNSLRVARALIRAHDEAWNPREHDQPGLVQRFDEALPGFFGETAPRACQVLVDPVAPDAILLVQPPLSVDEGGDERTFRITAN